MKRRKFLKLSGGTAASLLLSSAYTEKSEVSISNIETLIIGAGYGGAVTALRLAQAGHASTIVEMGLNWNTTDLQYKPFSDMLAPKANSNWLKKKTIAPLLNTIVFSNRLTGVLDRVDYENVKVYMGRGVGGGHLLMVAWPLHPINNILLKYFPI